MQDLIEKLEKATGPSRSLDVDIWAAITDPKTWRRIEPGKSYSTWQIRDRDSGEWQDYYPGLNAKEYTSSIDAALTLLPNEDHHWKAGYSRHVRHNAEVCDLMHPHKGVFIGEHDHSRAIALCIAALKARQAI